MNGLSKFGKVGSIWVFFVSINEAYCCGELEGFDLTQKKAKKANKSTKTKPHFWVLLVSQKLDKETRKYISETPYDSLAQFVRSAVQCQLENEQIESDGQGKPVLWNLLVPQSLDEQARIVAKRNYASLSDLIRCAMRSHMEKENLEKGELT